MVPDELKSLTRTRLLEAAAATFASHGFRNARIRDICRQADANIAAVNYHFRDKRGLYEAVLRNAFLQLPGIDLTDPEGPSDESNEQRLHLFIKSFLAQLLGGEQTALYARLVAREMLDPTDALDDVIQEGMRPQVDFLLRLLREFLGSVEDEQFVRRCAGSILGQCLYFHFGRPVILGTGLETTLSHEMLDELADHVTQFSLAALRHLKTGNEMTE
jgi:AcrR family transcriptional regulator